MDPIREIKKRIEEYRGNVSGHMMSGGVKSYEDYRFALGKVAAFNVILNDIADIEKKYLDE